MIQLALDASMVRQDANGADDVTLTVTVAGCSLADGSQGTAADWLKERVRDSLLPWNWPAPELVMFCWIKNNGTPVQSLFLKLAGDPGNGVEYLDPIHNHLNNYKNYYDNIIFEGLKDPQEIISNISLQDFLGPQNTVLNIDVTDDLAGDIKTTVRDTSFTGFLPATIAQLSQRTPPVNWLLNLAYLAFPNTPTDWVVPVDATGFVAFPISQTPGSPWSIAAGTVPTLIQNSDAAAPMFSLGYEPYQHQKTDLIGVWPPTSMTGLCLFTPLPVTTWHSNDTIILRDEVGNFKGEVQVQLSDVPDWLPALIKEESRYFHSCALMHAYLEANWTTIQCPAAADIPAFTKRMAQAEGFLYSTLRDVAGLGLRPAGNTATIPEQLAAMYCNQQFGKPETLSEQKLQEYWAAYDSIINHPDESDSYFIVECKKQDSNYDLNKWKELLANLSESLPENMRIRDQQTAIDNLALTLPGSPVSGPADEESQLTAWWEQVNSEVTRWLNAWKDFLKLTQNSNLLSRIVFAQLKRIPITTLKFEWTTQFQDTPEDWLLKACEQLADIQAVHQQGMACSYSKQLIAHIAKDSGAEVKLIIGDCLKAIEEHQTTRLMADSGYFPHLLSPAPAGGLAGDLPTPLTWQGFFDFCAAQIQIKDELGATAPTATVLLLPGLPVVLRKLLQKTTATVLPLKIKVDSATVAAGNADDLSDELAGHLVLMVRSQQRNLSDFAGRQWKHLNRALVKTWPNNDEQPFSDTLITPLFVPPPLKNQPPLLLEVSNEKPYLVAGHNRSYEALIADGRMAAPVINKPEQWFEVDPDQQYGTDELWYGYYYRAAAFVALNSGVLPEPIAYSRALPNIPKPEIPYANLNEKQTALHHFLRRVPVSRVRVMPGAYKPLPAGLQPLAYELKEWAGNEGSQTSPAADNPLTASQALYLLAPDIKDEASKNFAQETIELELRRPATSYENWKAWTAGELSNDIQTAAQKQDQENRTGKANSKIINEFCDPAVENVFILKAEPLFPKHSGADIQYQEIWLSPTEIANPLNDPPKQFKVSFSEGDPFKLTKDQLIVPKGWVVRLSIHAAIRQTYYSGNEQRFYEWMGQKPVAIEEYNLQPTTPGGQAIRCWLTHPTELWFEAAIRPDDKIITGRERTELSKPNEFALQLWKALQVEQKTDGVTASLDRSDPVTSRSFAYMSRAEVGHQVWSWNGRLDRSGDYFAAPDEYLIAANPDVKQKQREQALQDLKAQIPEAFDTLTLADLSRAKGSEALTSYVWKDALDPAVAGPKQDTTTPAMEWEAWAFSDRPDFTALTYETRLLAFRAGDTKQADDPEHEIVPLLCLYTDRRPGEEKALYYRFAIRAYSRYERLGAAYSIATLGTVPVNEPAGTGTRKVFNPWRRYMHLATRTHVLPRPAIRFVIPLTRSIEECGEGAAVGAASLLLVLEDRWFAEAGLAEQLEVGIDLLPSAEQDLYLNAGPDPILTGEALKPIPQSSSGLRYTIERPEGQNPVLVFRPLGPVGLTFDFAAQTPLLRGSTFVISLPDLTGVIPSASTNDSSVTNKLGPWAMMQIAVRRSLRPHFCQPGINTAELMSQWTAKEWVQVVPSTDALIPAVWRRQVAHSRYINLSLKDNLLLLGDQSRTALPAIANEDLMQRYYILTELVNDIGGQPVERYLGTYRITDTTQGGAKLVKDHEQMAVPTLQSGRMGYLRIMLVRKLNHGDESSVWVGLFGESANGKTADFKSIQNDPTLAMPLISERVPFRI